MKRILMLVENCPYPQDRRVSQEAAALTAAGFSVTVVCPAAPGQPRRSCESGVSVYRYPAPRSGTGLIGYAWEYCYSMLAALAISVLVLMRTGFDIVHAANPPDTYVFIGLLYKVLGKRFVYDYHDLSPEMYAVRAAGHVNPLVHSVLLYLEKLSYWAADYVLVPNGSCKKIAQKRGGVREDHIAIVRNGPDLRRMRVVEPSRELRSRASNIIAYVGVMAKHDGVDYLLRALHHLEYSLHRHDFHCVLIGDGEELSSLVKLSHELQLDGHVSFTGWLSGTDMVKLLAAADIGVEPAPSNPYTNRCTMIKMMEYMALSKPVVAFDLVEHHATAGPAAVYVRANDELEFAKAIALLIDNPHLRATMGNVGRLRIENQLQWSYSAAQLLAAYSRITGRVVAIPPVDADGNVSQGAATGIASACSISEQP